MTRSFRSVLSAVDGRVRAIAVAALALLLVAGTTATARFVTAPVDDGVITLLLLGSDDGPPRAGEPDKARADGFHLLMVSPDRQRATFLNIPRDSYVPVTGMGKTKINACLVGGPERCVSTVESHFGIDVDHHLLTSMHGLAEAFERFGGLEVDVERRLTGGGPDIEPGLQRLNGYQVLTYSRDRKNRPGGDFDRSYAQAEVLALAHAEAVRDADLRTIAESVAILTRHTITDASPAELLRYGYAALQLPPAGVDNVNLPARIGNVGKSSVVFLTEEAYRIVDDVKVDGHRG